MPSSRLSSYAYEAAADMAESEVIPCEPADPSNPTAKLVIGGQTHVVTPDQVFFDPFALPSEITVTPR